MLSKDQAIKFFRASPIPSLIILADAPSYTVAGINEAFNTLFLNKKPESVQKTFLQVLKNSDLNLPQQKMNELQWAAGEASSTKEKIALSITGKNKWKSEFTPVIGDNGEVELIINTYQNTNGIDSKTTFKEHYESLFANNPDGVFSFDLDGNFLTANEALLNLAECSLEELLKKNFDPFISPEDTDKVYFHFRKAVEGEIQHYDFNAITAKGNPLVLNITNFPIIIDGKIVGVYGIAKDISAKKRLEEELQNKSEEFRSVFDNSLHAIFITAPHKDFLDANNAAITMFGYSLENLNMIRLDRIFDATDGRLQEYIKTREENGKVKGELVGIRKNGNRFPIELSSSIYINSKGQTRAVTSISDLTFRKRAEERLKRSEKRFKMLVENSQDIISLTDKEGKLVYVNPAMERITGYDLSEIKGRHVFELVHPDYLNIIKEGADELLKNPGVPMTRTYCFKHKNGQAIWLEGTVTNYLHDEDIQAFVSNYHDITSRKINEEQLRMLNKQLFAAHQIAKIGYWSKDLVNNKDYWSEEMYNILGLENNEIPPTREQFFKFFHPEDMKNIEDFMIGFEKNPLPLVNEWRMIRKDGKIIDVLFKVDLQVDNKGLPILLEGTLQNITDQKENERLLKRMNDMLKSKTLELSAANKELQQFAYVASHDLKEPLRMINGFLKLLKTKYSSTLDETANTYIDYAVDGSNRMQQLIMDLLNYSRLGRDDDKKELAGLEEIIKEAQLNLMQQIGDSNATINVDKHLPSLEVHRSPMVRLVQNLLNNAIKFKKADIDPVIDISAVEENNYWMICINDNGIGMSEENYNKIFKIFSRLHTREEYPGTGMGLAICKKIVQMHGGEIWVESEKNKGSKFCFTIKKH